MKMPLWLKCYIGGLFALAATGLLLRFVWGCQEALSEFSAIALAFTLPAGAWYAWSNYRIAKWTSTPSASLWLRQPDRDKAPFYIGSFPKNHSEVALRMWCRTTATLYGTTVSLSGFYGGKKAWALQPKQEPHGVIDVNEILRLAGLTAQQALQQAEGVSPQEQLHLEVTFWYETLDSSFKSPEFTEKYYFDFSKGQLVLDA